MDIYALGLDDPDTRFGTSDDIRNWLLRLIIYSAAMSFASCESDPAKNRYFLAQAGLHTVVSISVVIALWDTSAIPDFGTHAVVLWEAMQHCTALHSAPQRESEGPPSDSAVKRP